MITSIITGWIRTIVPIVVGPVLAWLLARGIEVDSEVVYGAVSGLLSAAWYTLIRLLESRWPQTGWLLGVAKTPTYTGSGGGPGV